MSLSDFSLKKVDASFSHFKIRKEQAQWINDEKSFFLKKTIWC